MNSKYLISVKSSGLCFNIMRLIILTEVAARFDRELFFLTKPDHIEILKKFNNTCTFIPYVDNHTTLFNNFTRKKSIHAVYDLKYMKFLKDNYLNNVFNSPSISDFNFISGYRDQIVDSSHPFLIIDYNDGTHDADVINSIKIEDIIIDSEQVALDKDTLTVNVKINNSENKRIYKLWDELIPILKTFNKPIFLISGNNDIKKYLGDKHGCKYNITKSETNYSNIRGNNITRGKAFEIFNDVVCCSLSHFIPFTYFRKNHQDILYRYKDLNFVVEKEEKFDILAEYLSKYISIREP